MLAIIAVGALAHNGVVHKPLESSSMMVGPSLVDSIPYITFNYGMNYVKGFKFDSNWFPLAAVAVAPKTVFTVSDIGTGYRYTLSSEEAGSVLIETPSGCPTPDISKFVPSGGSLSNAVSLLMLLTGEVYDISYSNGAVSCSKAAERSWSAPLDWGTPWGPTDGNEGSTRFFSFAHWNDCNWYTLPYIQPAQTRVYSGSGTGFNSKVELDATHKYEDQKAGTWVKILHDGHIDASQPIPAGQLKMTYAPSYQSTLTLWHKAPHISGMPNPSIHNINLWLPSQGYTRRKVVYAETYDNPEVHETFTGLNPGTDYILHLTISDLDNMKLDDDVQFTLDEAETIPFLESVKILANGDTVGTMSASAIDVEHQRVSESFECTADAAGTIEVSVAQAFRYPLMDGSHNVSFTDGTYYAKLMPCYIQSLNAGGPPITNGSCLTFHDLQAGIKVEKISLEVKDSPWKVKAVSRCTDTSKNAETANLADGFADKSITHGGGELFVLNNQLYLANGDTSTLDAPHSLLPIKTSVASDDAYSAGKVLLIDADGSTSIASRGFRHPWSAVVHDDVAYIADVGQTVCEEVSTFDGTRANYGWPLFEGKTVGYPFAPLSNAEDPFVFPVEEDCRFFFNIFKINHEGDISALMLVALILLLIGMVFLANRAWSGRHGTLLLLAAALWIAFAALAFYPSFFHRDGSRPATILRHRPSVAIIYVISAFALMAVVPIAFCCRQYTGIAATATGTLFAATLLAAFLTFPSVWNLATMPYIFVAFAAIAIFGGAKVIRTESESPAYKELISTKEMIAF